MTVPLPLPKRPKRSNFKLVPNSQVHLNKANNATEVYDLEGAYSTALAAVKEPDFDNLLETKNPDDFIHFVPVCFPDMKIFIDNSFSEIKFVLKKSC